MRPQIFHRLASSKITTAPYWCHDWPLRDTMAVQRCHMLGQACDTAHCKLKTSARAHGGVIAFTRAAARVMGATSHVPLHCRRSIRTGAELEGISTLSLATHYSAQSLPKMEPLGMPLLAGSAGGDGSGGDTSHGESAAAAAASVSRPASPGPLADEAQPEPRQQELKPELEAAAAAEKPEQHSAALPMSVVLPARQRCLLALALAAALVSPLVLFYGVYFWLDALHYEVYEDARQAACLFVPVDPVAQQTIDDLIAMSKHERDSALHCVWGGQCSNISKSTVMQLLRDADDGIFSETWLASAPIALRNAFLSWLVVKLFFAASDIQDRGCCGLAIGGHGARESVVGQAPASAAGWLAAVGETSVADLYAAMKIWGWGLLGALPGAGAGYLLGLGLYSDQSRDMIADHISIEGLIGFSTFVPGALLTALLGFYYQLRTLAAASAQRQPSWEEARLSLGLTMRQAIGLSVAKFFLWHNLQPTAYLWQSILRMLRVHGRIAALARLHRRGAGDHLHVQHGGGRCQVPSLPAARCANRGQGG